MIRIAALNQELSEESCDAEETVRTKEAEVMVKTFICFSKTNTFFFLNIGN